MSQISDDLVISKRPYHTDVLISDNLSLLYIGGDGKAKRVFRFLHGYTCRLQSKTASSLYLWRTSNKWKFKAGKMMGGAFLFPVPLKTAQVKR